MFIVHRFIAALAAISLLCVGCAAERYEAVALSNDTPNSSALASESVAPKLAVEAPPGLDKTPDSNTAAVKRVIIYSGLINLVVPDIARTLEAVRLEATLIGGYLQEMDASSVTIRVPAARFQTVVERVSRFGEVVSKQVKSQDVTEEMRDLNIRLDNVEQTRKRLLAILEKNTKMEETLKIEIELQRVTETIELIKGKLQSLSSLAAFSVLKVQLNSPLPQKQLATQIPFEWIRHLGEGAVSGIAAQEAQSSWRDRREIRFDPPPSYIRYYDRDETTEAMSADGVLIKVQKHENYKGGDLRFWSGLARRVLVESRSVAFDRHESIQVQGKASGTLFVGTRDLAGQKSGYMIAIVVSESVIYTYEAWGPIQPFEQDRTAMEASMRSLEPRR